jgi:hypothetical protein
MAQATPDEVQRAYELLCTHAVLALLRDGHLDEPLKGPRAAHFELEGRPAVAALGPGRPMNLVVHWGCARPATAFQVLRNGLPRGQGRTMALGLLERRGRGLFLRPRRLGTPALRGKLSAIRALAEGDDPRPPTPPRARSLMPTALSDEPESASISGGNSPAQCMAEAPERAAPNNAGGQ